MDPCPNPRVGKMDYLTALFTVPYGGRVPEAISNPLD